MKILRWWLVVSALCALCVPGLSVRAAQLSAGDAVPVISAKDQRGTNFVSTNGLRYLLVATEMGCAKSANLKLAEKGAGYLEHHQAAYLMDIHSMPAVARFFAFPKMRKYPQRIVFIDDDATLRDFPVQSGRITVLALSPAGRISKISYWNPASEPVDGCFP